MNTCKCDELIKLIGIIVLNAGRSRIKDLVNLAKQALLLQTISVSAIKYLDTQGIQKHAKTKQLSMVHVKAVLEQIQTLEYEECMAHVVFQTIKGQQIIKIINNYLNYINIFVYSY
ncbi:Hypothetical_protein [Hexamita inflata]|uniref:Hypothetical_protein n=1 Tax=Hexamita inflata TaxID=28002 RepID=A0AA86UU61_9EUKA|nr:Hypothetical protein HINF_LOCUS59550 [Hexamita inflata]